MWFFGHLGIGSQIAKPLGRKLPWGAILWGTLLPDLIDKPLYYAHKFYIEKSAGTGSDLGLISCSRTFGHTGLLILALSSLAWWRRSRVVAGLALGMATHVLIDAIQDTIMGIPWREASSMLAVTWPFSGRFAGMPFHNLGEHLASGGTPLILGAELVGAFLLVREWRRRRYGLQKKYFASKKTAL